MGNEIVAARSAIAAGPSGDSFVPFAETAQERELLDLYRRLSPGNKAAIHAAMAPLAATVALATSVATH
jgi:hypothetical protein